MSRAFRSAYDIQVQAEPADLAFELHALASGGGVAARLLGDTESFDRTRRAMRRALGLPA